MKKLIKIAALGLIIIVLISGMNAIEQNKPKDVIKMMQKKYEKLNDFTADMLQIQERLFSDIDDTTALIFSLLKDDYFKIETSDVTIVTDGTVIKDYSIYEKKLTIDDVDKNSPNNVTPREYLFEFPKRYDPVDFLPEKRFGSTGYTLKMEPKKPDEEIMQFLEVWVDAADSLVKYVRYTDFNDNENIYLLSNYQVDNGLTPKDFELNIPEGVDVRIVDLRKKKG